MSLTQRIETLQKRRQKLKLELQQEECRPMPDFGRIGLLKRKNLWIKDRLVFLAHGGVMPALRQKLA